MAEAENQHVEARAIAKRLQDHPSINPHVDETTYKEMYKESIQSPDKFWGAVRVAVGPSRADRQRAREMLSWTRPFETVLHGGFEHGDMQWFPEGQLNAAYNCVDRHAYANPDKVRATRSDPTDASDCYHLGG